MMRKTIEILEIIVEVNRMNRESICHPEGRMALNSYLEGVLMNAGVYNGFGFLDATQVPAGQLPGIIWDPSGTGNHQFPDESRRVYYTSHKLRATEVRTSGVRKFKKKVQTWGPEYR